MTLVLIALVAVVTVAIVVVLAVALTTMTRSMNRIEQAVRPGAQPPPTAQTAVLPAAVAQPAVVTGASAPAAVAVAAPAPEAPLDEEWREEPVFFGPPGGKGCGAASSPAAVVQFMPRQS
jgi:hypothetical protein